MDAKLLEAVKRFKAGDESAFEEIYAKSFTHIKSGLDYMLKDEGLAEDLTQETFLKIYRNIGDLERPEKFTSWANTIAANQAKDHLRKLSAKEIAFTDLAAGSPEGEGTNFEEQLESEKAYEQPEKALDQKETQRMVREILDELPDGQRASITMFYYNDMKIREIASVTGRSESAIKQSLLQAKKTIEKKVKALAAQGVKLYSLTPFAFFLWLFTGGSGAALLPAAATAGAAGIAAAAATGAATAGAATAGVAAGAAATGGLIGWIAGLPTAVKAITAVLIGSAVIGGGVAAGVGIAKRNAPEEPPVTTAAEVLTSETEETEEPETSIAESASEEEPTEEATVEETEEESEAETEQTEESSEAPVEESTVAPVVQPTEAPTTAAPETVAPETAAPETAAPETEPETTEPESTEEALPDYVFKNEYFTFTLPESWRGKVQVEEIRYETCAGFQVFYKCYAIANMTYPGTDRNTEYGGVQAWKWVNQAQYKFVDFCGQSYGFYLEYWHENAYGYVMYNGTGVQVTEEFLKSETCREIIYLQTGEWVDIDEWYGKHSAEEDWNYELWDKTQAYYNILVETCISVP